MPDQMIDGDGASPLRLWANLMILFLISSNIMIAIFQLGLRSLNERFNICTVIN
ncbi:MULTISPECIES: hypothetical protein [unclassified Nostoc]|uniref:hypothetical protein n=1 Tax=unclassified Nostoc TaxID=2593658 RepID=UPI00261260F2|nr:hypothetical protein [Nostoc sp. S13]MDF5735681.1 hypothetical protein [Nostoc sp. S13]